MFDSFKNTGIDNKVTELLDKCIEHLHVISNNFELLTADWSDYVSNFNHYTFWNNLLGENGITIAGLSDFDEVIQEPDTNIKVKKHNIIISKQSSEKKLFTYQNVSSENQSSFFGLIKKKLTGSSKQAGYNVLQAANRNKLPKNFDPQNYLSLNPDVENSGIDPCQHWIDHGQYENRQY